MESETATPSLKRRKLGLQVSIETGADGKAPVQQVFSDGSYIPATDSHFERTSAAASAFVARALAAPAQGSTSFETAGTDSQAEATTRWAAKAVTCIEGAIYELGQAVAVIEALRASKPVLELKRTTGGGRVDVAEREGEGMLMAKKRLMRRSGEFLEERVKMMDKWIEGDNKFCEAFLMMRKRCNGVRRMANGTPLIDVGDGEFVPVLRGREGEEKIVRVEFPAETFLKFGGGVAPVVLRREEEGLNATMRRVKLSRVSAFRRRTFECMAKEVGNMRELMEITSNALMVECGPRDVIRVEKTQREGVGGVEDEEGGGDASLLQIIAMHACLMQGASSPPRVIDRVLAASSSRSVLSATEGVLDRAVDMLRCRVEWTRGASRVEESRVRVFATSADGDGPDRALLTVEPISNVNNGGNEGHNGHVRLIPAFGVIIAAPDDPSARGRALTAHSSSAGALGLDDVPRSYVCPVGGEILSVLTLLLCIRLLDALECTARSGVEEMLDVDRQCFTVIVSEPKSGRTLRARVWPKGGGVGEEVPGSTAWLNGVRVNEFPSIGPGRIEAWKQLLRKLVDDVKTEKEEMDVEAG